MTCDTNGVNHSPFCVKCRVTWRAAWRATWLVPLLVSLLVATACDNSGTPATTDTLASQTEALPINEDIPVEALPDPLPAPYLFTDEITIEDAPVTEIVYVVQPGDRLVDIAGRFCITVEEIQRLNTIVDISHIDIGDELRIPIREGACGAAAPVSSTPSQPSEPQRAPGEIYIVQPGDTLSGIGAAFGFTWVELMNYNGLTEAQANTLPIGTALIIPPPADADTQSEQSEESETDEPPG